jgi:hypothetical protein
MWVNFRQNETITPLSVLYEQMSMQSGMISMSIGVDENSKLTCSPFATHRQGVSKVSIRDLDLSKVAGKWIHVSCAWDKKEYPSFFFIQDETEAVRKSDTFTGSIASGFVKNGNATNVGFRELRVW